MAFQSVPRSAEAVITYTGHGQTFKNVVAAQKPTDYDLADLEALAAAVDLAVGTFWLPRQSSDYLYLNTTVRGLNDPNDQEASDNTNSGLGAKAATALPDNVTISIKKSSGFTGRSARGRLYWIGTPLADIATNENSYIASAVDDIVDAIDEVRQGIDATVWSPVVISRFTNGLERPFGVTFPWIGTEAVNNDVDSQRRRLIG